MVKDDFDFSFYQNEKELLEKHDMKNFLKSISEIAFRCDMCAGCCTGVQNDHVFLLEEDLDRILKINKEAVRPAPLFDFSDQFGNFYAPGYSLKSNDDDFQSCFLLNGNKCSIYEERPLICRVYPFMIHREPDSKGKVDWRYFGGLGDHGCYNSKFSEDELNKTYENTIKYEIDYLNQEINFRKFIKEYFEKNNLVFIKRKHAELIRDFNSKKQGSFVVYVYNRNNFEKNIVNFEK